MSLEHADTQRTMSHTGDIRAPKDASGSIPVSSQEPEKLWTSDFVFVAVVNMLMFMGFQMTTAGIPVYINHLGGSSFEVGLATTFATVASVLVRPLAGMVLDRTGRRGIFVFGIVLMLVAVVMFALVPFVGVVLALRFVQGIGWGLGSTSSSALAAQVVPRHRFAEGMGYFALTISLAVAIAPALSVVLLESVSVYAMIAVSALFLVVACVFAAMLVMRLNRKAPCADTSKSSEVQPKRTMKFDDLFDRSALLPAVLIACMNVPFAGINTFVVLHGQSQGVDNVAIYFIVYAVVTFVTRPIVGRIVDKRGYFGPGIGAVLCVIVTMIVIGSAHTTLYFVGAGVLSGLGFGTSISVFQSMAVASVPGNRRGVATATYMVGFDGGIAIGSVACGIAVGMLGYAGMFFASALAPAAAGVALVIMGPRRLATYRYKPTSADQRDPAQSR